MGMDGNIEAVMRDGMPDRDYRTCGYCDHFDADTYLCAVRIDRWLDRYRSAGTAMDCIDMAQASIVPEDGHCMEWREAG